MTKKNGAVPSKNSATRELTLKVFGVGGAGCNAVQHFAEGGFVGVSFAALNTDIQSLLDLSVETVVPLGAKLTRGLGAAGDPALGRAATVSTDKSSRDRKSTRLNSSHVSISYALF